MLELLFMKLANFTFDCTYCRDCPKLTWLALGEDHAARSRGIEQLTAL